MLPPIDYPFYGYILICMSTTPADSAAINHEVPRSTVVAQRLRIALAARDLSVSAAARTLGWSQSNLQRMTKGHVKLSIDQLDWVQARLGIPMTYLLGLSDELPGLTRPGTVRKLRTASDPAEVIFNDGSGELPPTASGESFLSESNRRPFHYKGNAQIIAFPFRPRKAPAQCPAGQVATVIPFPA